MHPNDGESASGDPGVLAHGEGPAALGDFTTTRRVVPISILAVAIGVLAAFVALALLRLIGLFTNLFFYHRWSMAMVSPATNTLGPMVILVPVAGALVIGLMARFGSERIRGHGIPEAIEAILINGSKVEPKLAILKPLSSAISIGSGGPFGAEGPIIMTGGAFGSLLAQFFHLTSVERKTLLVAGAAGGMSATFAAPVAAVLLAVELLLFEWKPRSLIPVALASAAAALVRRHLLGLGPLFAVPAHAAQIGLDGFACCVVAGLAAGLLAALLTAAVYTAEDGFGRLPIHWMWWPAIGGLVIGLGGWVFPRALGVGYDTIETLLQGNAPEKMILGVLLVKSFIWAVSLGSGTSGGVLAPLLMIGSALGGVEARIFPHEGAGFWPLVSMGAILGGTMRAPFTGVVFALELTHDLNAMLPLLIAVVVAHATTVLLLRRSILTEKVARRGFHLTREYAIDPLEILLVRDAMRTEILVLRMDASREELHQALVTTDAGRRQTLFPVVDREQRLAGVLTHHDLSRMLQSTASAEAGMPLAGRVHLQPVTAYPEESLKTVVNRMAATSRTRLPVIERGEGRRVLGTVSLSDLLKARARDVVSEQRRERILAVPLFLPEAEIHGAALETRRPKRTSASPGES